MTAGPSIEPARFLHEQLTHASPDLLRELLGVFIDALMGAEADAICGAEYGARSPERTNVRNGYRHRDFDTRVGTMDVAIPKLRAGTYFPDWLLERRRRAEAALTSVVATCYLLGVSTRRMDKLVESLGITRLSKSQVSRMAADLDEQVHAFRTRPLDAGPYTFLAADALTVKVREGGRVVSIAVMVATGVNADGHREILGIDVSTAEDGAGWLTFFRDLTARGLTGVKLVTSDAHSGLVAAIGATLPGAGWQRCRTHYAANLMSTCPKSSWPWVKTMLHSVYDQPDTDAVNAQFVPTSSMRPWAHSVPWSARRCASAARVDTAEASPTTVGHTTSTATAARHPRVLTTNRHRRVRTARPTYRTRGRTAATPARRFSAVGAHRGSAANTSCTGALPASSCGPSGS